MINKWLSINYTTKPVNPVKLLIPLLICNGICSNCKDLICLYI